MRKVVYGINQTLDGCCDHTKVSGTDDIHIYFADLMRNADLVVYGRKTYELMVPFWPNVAKEQSESEPVNEFAQVFDSIDRLVFSRTLRSLDDKKTKLVNTNPVEEILRLKQQPGKDISLGGVELPLQLILAGLVDEFHLVIHPVIVGQGRRLFDGTDIKKNLQLELGESKPFPSGCVALIYVKK
ncbi:dihydrofolate reductase family protein [Mucilaginibacter sp. L3T2-6]|uniref:dihydrofolate reductase family protein n=1 Tax=Mucilaginibacter sp. L3T2-6 TaxID=3062491 RepID=UPI002675060E|nr:dihydrofolate reductase family protein [Mucilaginibacter sp. L3T2-6]MDO3644042.1 dihydrofolate reductase family protein [Mucilaginibacter sp. L3T2-6]MDV6216493.1 dihydrofolate reductase family protein [Mucilaginibacter sp. L3T2-6]